MNLYMSGLFYLHIAPFKQGGYPMKRCLYFAVIFSILITPIWSNTEVPPSQKARLIESYGKIPLSFTVNQGQLDSRVKFTTRGSGCTMFFTQEGTTFLLSREREEKLTPSGGEKQSALPLIFGKEKGSGDEFRRGGKVENKLTPLVPLCVGSALWEGSTLAITVWSDNSQTDEIGGMLTDYSFIFRIWDLETERVYYAGRY